MAWTGRLMALIGERLEERGCGAALDGSGAEIVLSIARDLPGDGFSISDAGAVRISGGSPRGVLYGVGKFLRTSGYEGGFAASAWRGTSVPHCPVRGIYYASHFHNWYVMASPAEVARYTADLALWGMNLNVAICPFINLDGWDDPQTEAAIERLRGIRASAKEWDLDFCMIVCPNNLFRTAPDDTRAVPLPDPLHRHGDAGVNLCPSKPAGHGYIMAAYRRLFERLARWGEMPVDYLCLWPYDEGGCACEQCRPWGANGFLRLAREVADLARAFMPRVKIILSTWTFDTPPEGEWEALRRAMEREGGEGSWVDCILADSHDDYPRYPLEVAVPGNKPLLNFPEISMWGNSPWGGWGAHVLPGRFERLWRQIRHVCQGGFAYSEGIYEDMNKAAVLQFYWHQDGTAEATLREYVDYEFSPAVQEEALRLIGLLEGIASEAGKDEAAAKKRAGDARRAFELAEAIQGRLPAWALKSWRWRIVYLRALLDRERFAGGGSGTAAAQGALRELLGTYHAPEKTDDPYHAWVRPPAR